MAEFMRLQVKPDVVLPPPAPGAPPPWMAKRPAGIAAFLRIFRSGDLDRGRHHFDPPHRIEPERLGTLLREHWDRAESKHHAPAS